MRHPTEGVLRRLLDEPAGVASPDRAHVAGCRQCLDLLATVREDAALVGAALTGTAVGTVAGTVAGAAAGTAAGADIDAGWHRLVAAAPADPPKRAMAPRPGRFRRRCAGPP